MYSPEYSQAPARIFTHFKDNETETGRLTDLQEVSASQGWRKESHWLFLFQA